MGEDRTNINGTFNIGQGAVMILRGSRWSSTLNLTGTLNVYEGSIVKFDNTTGISVKEGANLNINGTSTQKVHFTSYRDDSVGGDTNGDGNATNPSLIDSTTMLNMDGGTAYVINASFNFASRNIVGTTTSPSLKVFDSSFANSGSAIDVSVSNIKIYRNTFNVQPDYIFNPVALRNVTDISRFGLSGSDQNFFTGTSPHSRIVQFSDSALPSDRSFVVTQSSGAALKFKGDHNNIYGNLTVSDNGTLITEGGYYSPAPNLYGTLTVKKGSTIKAAYTSGINVMDGGKLNLLGDANNRIKVTHYSDDALGGDTNGDGNNTVPQTGGYSVAHTSGGEVVANFADIYYAGAIFSVTNGKVNADNIRSSNSMQLASVGTNGEAMITNAQISNAKTGLSVSGSGRVVLRGSLISSQSKAVEACNWGQSCSVDAAYVDWGTGGAPAAGMVCGQVTVSPWANGSASSSDGLFTSKNCDNLPTPADQLASSTQHFGQRMSTRGIDCGNGFEDACEAMRNAQRCIGAATDLAASTSSFPLPSSNPYEQPAQFGEVLASGVTAYIQEKEGAIPILTALEFGDKLIEALETVMNVADAYNTCAP